MKFIKTFLFLALLQFGASFAFAQSVGSVAGQVQDTLGAIVVGATVTAVAPDGKEKQAISNARGEFSIAGLAPGKYTIKAIAPKFALYENTEVVINAGEPTELPVILTVSGIQENVNVETGTGISTDPNENASATVIKGKIGRAHV